MEHERNGDSKVSYEQELFGRRRNNTLPAAAYLDLTSEAVKSSTPSRRRANADGELDVFSAERYFKGAIAMDDDDHHRHREGSAAAPPVEPVSKPAWTCASAAASAGSGASTNSQTVLLRDARRRGNRCCLLQVSELLRPCSGKRAVRIDGGGGGAAAKESSKTAAGSIEWYRDLRMEKASLELAGEGKRGGVVVQPKVAAIGGSGRQEKAGEYMSASFRRGSFTLQAPVKVRGGCRDDTDKDDCSGSESSSDLFEIKSLMIDECPYEPSEASIQWSVVTASAVDMSGTVRGLPVTMRQNRVGLLTGCVSSRAVNSSAITAVRRFPPECIGTRTAPSSLERPSASDRAAAVAANHRSSRR